jgi:hypothetical protein
LCLQGADADKNADCESQETTHHARNSLSVHELSFEPLGLHLGKPNTAELGLV